MNNPLLTHPCVFSLQRGKKEYVTILLLEDSMCDQYPIFDVGGG